MPPLPLLPLLLPLLLPVPLTSVAVVALPVLLLPVPVLSDDVCTWSAPIWLGLLLHAVSMADAIIIAAKAKVFAGCFLVSGVFMPVILNTIEGYKKLCLLINHMAMDIDEINKNEGLIKAILVLFAGKALSGFRSIQLIALHRWL